jgi:hypothetical protein
MVVSGEPGSGAAGLLISEPVAFDVHSVSDVVQHGDQDGPFVPARRDVVGPGGRGDLRQQPQPGRGRRLGRPGTQGSFAFL